jgi:hypothetical protein
MEKLLFCDGIRNFSWLQRPDARPLLELDLAYGIAGSFFLIEEPESLVILTWTSDS